MIQTDQTKYNVGDCVKIKYSSIGENKLCYVGTIGTITQIFCSMELVIVGFYVDEIYETKMFSFNDIETLKHYVRIAKSSVFKQIQINDRKISLKEIKNKYEFNDKKYTFFHSQKSSHFPPCQVYDEHAIWGPVEITIIDDCTVYIRKK